MDARNDEVEPAGRDEVDPAEPPELAGVCRPPHAASASATPSTIKQRCTARSLTAALLARK
jgi:hypothetical protein